MSSLFTYFQEMLNTAYTFKQNPYAYFTVKSYAFGLIQHQLRQGGVLQGNEYKEFSRLEAEWSTELKVSNNQAYVLNKENFEKFLSQTFSTIDFQRCNYETLKISVNLINVLGMYGAVNERFAMHRNSFKLENYLQNRMMTFNQNHGNEQLARNEGQQNARIAEENHGNPPQSKTQKEGNQRLQTNDSKATDPSVISFVNKDLKIPLPQDLGIRLPVAKGSPEYKTLKEKIIVEHLMYAEQEALFNKIDEARRHIEAVIYYLNNIQDS